MVGVTQVTASQSDAVPKTAADFADCLWWWLQSTPEMRESPAVYDAWQRYVRETVQHANDYGVVVARAFHSSCMEALQNCWWHPQSHGPAFDLAYSKHIAPLAQRAAGKASARAWGRSAGSSASGGSKRKAPPSGDQQSQATRSRLSPCSLHPDSNHTDAQCFQQLGNVRQPAQPTSGPAALRAAGRLQPAALADGAGTA
jgi:hypothetical protein